jgi:hypothetical protein
MIPHRGNPAISFQVYFKNGIHKLTSRHVGPAPRMFPTAERKYLSNKRNAFPGVSFDRVDRRISRLPSKGHFCNSINIPDIAKKFLNVVSS